MDDRAQLIQNIILSEIKYAEWKAELATAEGDRADELNRLIASDDELVATWMQNYGITFDDLAVEREATLLAAKERKAEAYEIQQQEIKDQIAKLSGTLEELPAKRDDELVAIDDLINQPIQYL